MMNELSDRLQSWMASGRFTRVGAAEVWYRVDGEGPWLVCLHGFPTSSRDWMWLLPLLSGHYRILIFDFPGYGLSDKDPARDFSLLSQCDVLEALCASLGIEDFHLLAHDMGNSVACELLYRIEQAETPLSLHSVTLLNGGVYMDLHQPLPTQRLLRSPILGPLTARLSSYRVFRHQYPRVYAQPEDFDESHRGGLKILARIAGYMKERERMGERWTGPLERLRIPLQLIWGWEDAIAVSEIAQRLSRRNPCAQLIELPSVGHYPQLEAPERTAAAVVRFIQSLA
jgi:pimeloyl-ACP methyl ester carboxylesterase